MANKYWIGVVNGTSFTNTGNWLGGVAPVAGDNLFFLTTTAGWVRPWKPASISGAIGTPPGVLFGTITANDGSDTNDGWLLCGELVLSGGSATGSSDNGTGTSGPAYYGQGIQFATGRCGQNTGIVAGWDGSSGILGDLYCTGNAYIGGGYGTTDAVILGTTTWASTGQLASWSDGIVLGGLNILPGVTCFVNDGPTAPNNNGQCGISFIGPVVIAVGATFEIYSTPTGTDWNASTKNYTFTASGGVVTIETSAAQSMAIGSGTGNVVLSPGASVTVSSGLTSTSGTATNSNAVTVTLPLTTLLALTGGQTIEVAASTGVGSGTYGSYAGYGTSTGTYGSSAG